MNETTLATAAATSSDQNPLVGREWKVVVTGRKALNGERHSMTITGVVEEAVEGESIFDALRSLADHIEVETADMQYPDSLRVSILPE